MTEREAHVRELAEAGNVEVIYRGSGIGYRRERRITIPHIKSQVTYLIALHELGHVLGPHPRLRLEQEVAAWRWALDNSREDLTPATYRSITRRLESYQRRAERWASMVIPEEFGAFLAEMRSAAQ